MIKELCTAAFIALAGYGLYQQGEIELLNGYISGVGIMCLGIIIMKAPW